MSAVLYWLVLTALMTALFWLPYVLQRIMNNGLIRTMGNPDPKDKPLTGWAQRAQWAHANAAENLAVFAPLALAAHVAGVGNNPVIGGAAMVYFFARLAHYAIYTAGIPMLRTLSFAAGWAATVAIGLALVGVI